MISISLSSSVSPSTLHRSVIGSHFGPMKSDRIEDVRFENLMTLFAEFEREHGTRGAAARLAEASEMAPAYLSQLRRRKRGIGSKAAAKRQRSSNKAAGNPQGGWTHRTTCSVRPTRPRPCS